MSDDMQETGSGRDGEFELDANVASALGELPLEIAPERELFPEVKRRIQARRAANRRRLLALAAGLALALGAAYFFRPAPPEVRERAVPTTALAALRPESAVRHTAFSEPDRALEQIRTQLRLEIESKQERLPPETRKLVFENLATIDRAIAEIESALAAEPANAELGRTYIAYREREIDLLRQANRVAARL
jgi:hypothetical protein